MPTASGVTGCSFPKRRPVTLKVVAQNAAAIPAWHPGAGSKGFLFVDEVVVE